MVMAKISPILLLTVSNVFMTFAWYGHLKHGNRALWLTIIISWGIAFFEYIFQVPANRLGSEHFSAAQLKIIQEVLSLSVFAIFSVTYLKEQLSWNYLGAFLCMMGAVAFMFLGGKQ